MKVAVWTVITFVASGWVWIGLSIAVAQLGIYPEQ